MNLILAAAALIAAAACTNDDNVTVDNNAPVAARITATMAGDDAVATPATRAINDHWNGDHIGVIVLSSYGSDMAARYLNAHYATTSTGTTATFAPIDAANTIYFADTDNLVTFAAYAPYQPSATPGELPGTDGVITIDATRQTTPAGQEAVDFILATGAAARKDAPTVAFTRVDATNDYSFRHIMTRLVLKIETPAAYGFSPDDVNDISRISLKGLCTGGLLDFKKDPATGMRFNFDADESTRTADWDIAGYVHTVGPDKNGVMQRTHTLIIPDQSVRDISGNSLQALPISITLNNQVYTNNTDIKGDADFPGNFFTGKSYEYTIRLKKTGLEVSGATITDWVDGGSGWGDAVRE